MAVPPAADTDHGPGAIVLMLQADIANRERDSIRRTLDEVKQHAPTTPVSLFVFVAIGTTDEIGPLQSNFASPFT